MLIYGIVEIYYESFNFVIFAMLNALAKVKDNTHFWIHISSMYLLLWIYNKSKSQILYLRAKSCDPQIFLCTINNCYTVTHMYIFMYAHVYLSILVIAMSFYI